jgi:hypothetical protein
MQIIKQYKLINVILLLKTIEIIVLLIVQSNNYKLSHLELIYQQTDKEVQLKIEVVLRKTIVFQIKWHHKEANQRILIIKIHLY